MTASIEVVAFRQVVASHLAKGSCMISCSLIGGLGGDSIDRRMQEH